MDRSAKKIIVSCCKVAGFLCVLPCVIIYLQFRQSLSRHPLLSIRQVTRRDDNSFSRPSLYANQHHEAIYHRLTSLGDATTLSRELFRGDYDEDGGRLEETDSEWCLREKRPFRYRVWTDECLSKEKVETTRGWTVQPYPPISPVVSPTTNPTWNLVVLEIPATSLLILFHIVIAWFYWDRRIQPSAVALVYDRLLDGGEAWRVFTGGTAHFEVMHGAVNMMSLSALGQEVEGRRLLTSTEFLSDNVVLLPLVAMVWGVLQWVALRRHRQRGGTTGDYQPPPTVGFSGVLFAWMVVASLEQKSTCPVIFLPSLCFPTYNLLGFVKFSWSPLVQLVVIQVILPRVSFTGHLAGIVMGYAWYWKLLPLVLVHPAVAIPSLYFGYLVAFRRDTMNWRSLRDKQQQHLLAILALAIGASWTVLESPSFVLGMALSMMYWSQLGGESLSAVWTKGFVVAAVLVLVTDSMALGTWLVLGSATVLALGVLVVRAMVLLACVSYVLPRVAMDSQSSGIFGALLDFTTVQPCKMIGSQLWGCGGSQQATDSWSSATSFSGPGQRLGGTSRDADHQQEQMSRLV